MSAEAQMAGLYPALYQVQRYYIFSGELSKKAHNPYHIIYNCNVESQTK